MSTYFENLAWFPPAETKIPWAAILSAFNREPGIFRDDLCRYLSVKYCVLGDSARALLFKLLEVLKKRDNGQRDEVLLPGYTCYSVAAAVAKAGLKISTYDLDPATLYPDPDSFKSAVSKRTLAVVIQHLFGILTPTSQVKKIARKYDAYLIEDAAQAFGAVDSGNMPGTTGDFGIFSYGRGKPLPVGSGGALVSHTHSDIFSAIRLDSPKNGYERAIVSAIMQIISKPSFYWIPELLPLGLGNTVFDSNFDVEPMSSAINQISHSALPYLNHLNMHRKKLSYVYLKNLSRKYLIENIEKSTSMIRFPVLFPSDTALTRELKRMGVRKLYPRAISEESAIRPYLSKNQIPTPKAKEISKKLFTLPTHLGINETLAKRISAILKKTIG